MRKPLFIVLALGVVAAAFLVGSWFGGRGASPDASAVQNPGSKPPEGSPPAVDPSGFPPGTVNIGPEKQQLIGIRFAEVRKEPLAYSIRVLGRIAADETKIQVINSATRGWIVDVSPVAAGSLVKKGQVLATFYAPELLTAQQSYHIGLSGLSRLSERPGLPSDLVNPSHVGLAEYRDSLLNLGMGEAQIDEITKSRVRARRIDMTSPATGVVLSRSIFAGQRFFEETEFFRIADLKRVWILVDVFEFESEAFVPGNGVKIRVPGRNLVLDAVVSRALPLFDPASRTLKVRLEADNPGLVLRPDLFVDAELPVEISPAISVPRDAVLDTGLKKVVFVDRGGGFLEPREIETGRRLGGRVEVLKGLEPGERIVVSGTFLVDSESRMELAASGLTPDLATDPVCGMAVSMKKAVEDGRTSAFEGKTYFFCSAACKARFDLGPKEFVAPAPSAEEAEER
jgi:Cu(I)/Ag(I) efflux system membrane fusion protein